MKVNVSFRKIEGNIEGIINSQLPLAGTKSFRKETERQKESKKEKERERERRREREREKERKRKGERELVNCEVHPCMCPASLSS